MKSRLLSLFAIALIIATSGQTCTLADNSTGQLPPNNALISSAQLAKLNQVLAAKGTMLDITKMQARELDISDTDIKILTYTEKATFHAHAYGVLPDGGMLFYYLYNSSMNFRSENIYRVDSHLNLIACTSHDISINVFSKISNPDIGLKREIYLWSKIADLLIKGPPPEKSN